MNKISILLSFIFIYLILPLSVFSQSRNRNYEEYITQYKSLAIEQMNRYKIPASITLAQGLLESGAGKSGLSVKSNNHFGIKCGGDWDGRSVSQTDDAPNECFRAYSHVRESYEDHSKFLRFKPRYSALFQLNITDYKGWAHGLKKAGYATDPQYAYRLINIIELYGLDKYDTKSEIKWAKNNIETHQPYISNDLLYIVARSGDTLKKISEEFDISERKLRKYNDLYKGYLPSEGDIIYLEKKNSRASKDNIVYVVRGGDSMHSISQRYGIRLKNLYKLNKMSEDDATPAVGTIIRMR